MPAEQKTDHAQAARIQAYSPPLWGSAVLTVLYPPLPSSSPLLTVNSEYWLVEFRNFSADHWSEVLFQLAAVLLSSC